jgi:hypothetical protein
VNHHDPADAGADRLIFLADALELVPFSETTLRRAISKGELEAWQPNADGKLIMWRSTLIAWATRRPAPGRREPPSGRQRRTANPSARQPRPTAGTALPPDPILLPDLR